jgi:hypothetical protein
MQEMTTLMLLSSVSSPWVSLACAPRVVEQMPCDTVVKEDQEKGQECRDRVKHGDPGLAIQVCEDDEPVSSTKRLIAGQS